MRKGKMLNSDIIEIISRMGHTDEIVIADAGLPIPNHVPRIDMALIQGLPSFIQVLDALLETYECEGYVLADEISEMNPDIETMIKKRLPQAVGSYVSHEVLKERCHDAKAVIRTGECTPYANIILKSGVIF